MGQNARRDDGLVRSPALSHGGMQLLPTSIRALLKFLTMTQTSLGWTGSSGDIRKRQRRRVVVLERVGAKS